MDIKKFTNGEKYILLINHNDLYGIYEDLRRVYDASDGSRLLIKLLKKIFQKEKIYES